MIKTEAYHAILNIEVSFTNSNRNWGRFGLTLLCSLIGLGNSRHFLNQSDLALEVGCEIFIWDLLEISSFHLIGRLAYFTSGFTT